MSKAVPNPPHPGTYLQEELDARDMSNKTLAGLTGMHESVISSIVRGRADINADRAVKIGKALGTSAEVWMNLQSAYNLSKAKQPQDGPAVE
jgi:HTH-type transcriptional regulator/antitoxin HigA